jgi:hypothetical protein
MSSGQVGVGLTITFRQHRVPVTHYALAITAVEQPARWRLGAFLDDIVWRTVDVQRGAEVMDDRRIRTFALTSPVDCCRLRLSSFDMSEDEMIVHGFDVFGTILT